jgi:hypothetical protein
MPSSGLLTAFCRMTPRLRLDQAKRLKELERENTRLQKLLAQALAAWCRRTEAG